MKVIHDISEMNRIEPGDVLVTDMIDLTKLMGRKHLPSSLTVAVVPVTRTDHRRELGILAAGLQACNRTDERR